MEKLKRLPVFSAVLVGINVIIFLWCTFIDPELYQAGMLDVYRVLVCHEYGRIIWSLFFHLDIDHLVSNMVILFFMGSMVEEEIGHVRYLLLYFLSGIGSGVMSLLFKVMSGSMMPSIGASGAVFGLDGVLLAMVLFWDRKLPNVTAGRVVLMILLSLYSGFSGENIDNFAHIGGLLTGFLGGCAVCLFQRRKSRKANYNDEVRV